MEEAGGNTLQNLCSTGGIQHQGIIRCPVPCDTCKNKGRQIGGLDGIQTGSVDLFRENFLEFTVLVHFHENIAAADKLTFYVQLGNGRPV